MRCDTPEEVATLMATKWRMGLKGGVVVANPIPQSSEIIASEMAPVIEKAVAEAARQNISGKNVTPFLLARLAEVTGGRSLKANLALVKHNAAVAAEIAKAFAAARNN